VDTEQFARDFYWESWIGEYGIYESIRDRYNGTTVNRLLFHVISEQDAVDAVKLLNSLIDW
jgi:hypothetical protein